MASDRLLRNGLLPANTWWGRACKHLEEARPGPAPSDDDFD